MNIPVLQRLEAVCLAIASVAAMAQLGSLLWVVGETVLTFWALSGILLATSVTLRLVSSRAARGAGVPPFPLHVRLMRSTVAAVVCVLFLVGAFSDMGASYRVLDPPAANGCRAVVREVSFLFAGRGDVYAMRFGGIGLHKSSWTTDDGYEPVAHGSYTLDWDGNEGVLDLIGGIDPVWPTVHAISCS
ncbi:hypothetical protein [Arthrobacter sp. ISL-95]|uniref:hypothetical protein n=1 Tax=Arthrobacter sp. ISL-95 TaxID=2819116 RepID=UPI001BE64E9F|nr:hypothetical protein [Arthrobacter sp. ISL-95]MBT2585004.1 hypothetical protein [Arthrobacter sp. ISL-95]